MHLTQTFSGTEQRSAICTRQPRQSDKATTAAPCRTRSSPVSPRPPEGSCPGHAALAPAAGPLDDPEVTNPQRITENINVFDFDLSTGELAVIDALSAQRNIGDFAPKLVSLTTMSIRRRLGTRRTVQTRSQLGHRRSVDCRRPHRAAGESPCHGEGQRSDRGRTERGDHPLTFYAGWPGAMSAIMLAKSVFNA